MKYSPPVDVPDFGEPHKNSCVCVRVFVTLPLISVSLYHSNSGIRALGKSIHDSGKTQRKMRSETGRQSGAISDEEPEGLRAQVRA
jgi:hypothetical protein